MNPTLFTRRYGQVFLKDRNVARFEVLLLELPPESRILEIGPGEGILTKILLDSGYMVTCVESDHRFVEILREKFPSEINDRRLNIEKMDFLSHEKATFDGIIGNIPYHISSGIIFKLNDFEFDKAVLMVQEEFSDRLIARPNSRDYARISINAQLRYEITAVRKVSREKFHPKPKVNSKIIMLKLRNTYGEDLLSKVDNILRTVFSNRRKKLGTILNNVPEKFHDMRPGELTPEEYVELTYCLQNSFPE
ncbi:MAG: 16S rRNA (adenine(1518)-N(6)/adenine(1519)-N(6))-dimethyltransferase RsmA [Thermoplasmatales archaeon]|nr:16S rRNA (adenine(1518)-N(6)/adenine(1519)-N(6))-dimethyltransferase RsmA [Thermoplasmatales archaeon]